MTPDPFSSRELGGGLGTRLINRQRGGGVSDRKDAFHSRIVVFKQEWLCFSLGECSNVRNSRA